LPIRSRFLALLVLAAAAAASCRKPPGEPVFVITSESYTQGSDTLASPPPETLALVPPETLSLPPETLSAGAPRIPDVQILALSISGSLYSSLEALGCQTPDVIAAHLVRCLWWRMNPWRDICAGDSIIVLYADSMQGMENRTVALRYIPVPGSSVDPFSVYVFKRTGDNFPSHYYGDGTEVAELLNTLPVSTFEEITGIYGEPRGDHTHSGIDFKAPEGTPVRTARGGVVVRTDWNYSYNGHCVEIDMGGGYAEIFLHLNSIATGVSSGASLSAGALVGEVGNTGRSYSAHLHYQINDENDYPIDPLLFFATHHRSLEGADLASFRVFRDRCDGMMNEGRTP
jgi:murein DD-endopeptidase